MNILLSLSLSLSVWSLSLCFSGNLIVSSLTTMVFTVPFSIKSCSLLLHSCVTRISPSLPILKNDLLFSHRCYSRMVPVSFCRGSSICLMFSRRRRSVDRPRRHRGDDPAIPHPRHINRQQNLYSLYVPLSLVKPISVL